MKIYNVCWGSCKILCWAFVFSVIKEWKATTAYSVNDLVVYSGNIYKCKTAHTSGSSFDSTEQENWTTLWVIATKTQVDNLFI